MPVSGPQFPHLENGDVKSIASVPCMVLGGHWRRLGTEPGAHTHIHRGVKIVVIVTAAYSSLPI